jgi:hypothetical protein
MAYRTRNNRLISNPTFALIAGATVSVLGAVQTANAALSSAAPIISSTALLPFPSQLGVTNAAVKSGDTFGIAVVGFNNTGSGSYLTALLDPVFGTTTTYTGDALNGQVLTVTASESVSGGTTTDLITISVPTNFDPTGTVVGSPSGPVTSMEADLGAYNAGTDTLDFSSNISSATLTGSMTYSGGNFVLNDAGSAVFTNGGTSFGTAEGVNAGGADLAAFGIHAFNFSISYPTPVPEPVAGGTLLTLAGASVLRRRRPTGAV